MYNVRSTSVEQWLSARDTQRDKTSMGAENKCSAEVLNTGNLCITRRGCSSKLDRRYDQTLVRRTATSALCVQQAYRSQIVVTSPLSFFAPAFDFKARRRHRLFLPC